MKKLILGIIITIISIITLIGIAGFIKFNVLNDDIYVETNSGNVVKYNDIIKVETSIIPLASIANYIGGDFVQANSLIPAGVSEHNYDLKPEQIVEIEKSNLIIHLGLEHIDGFLDKAIKNKEALIVSEGIELIKGGEHIHEDNEDEEEHKEEEHIIENENHNESDPHIWLSTKNAIIIAEKITKKLSEINPDNKAYFENNLNIFQNEIETIKNDFKLKNENKKIKEFIVFHDAYNYLFDDLGIDSNKKIVFQKNVLSDPNSNEMKELIDEIKLHGVNISFREPQLNDSNLQKLSIEYNLKVEILDPVGNNISKNGYIENLKANLASLEKIYE